MKTMHIDGVEEDPRGEAGARSGSPFGKLQEEVAKMEAEVGEVIDDEVEAPAEVPPRAGRRTPRRTPPHTPPRPRDAAPAGRGGPSCS